MRLAFGMIVRRTICLLSLMLNFRVIRKTFNALTCGLWNGYESASRVERIT